jgi:lysozyme
MMIKDYLIKHEGLKLKPYRCTAGKLTIGVGRNLDDKGISEKEALVMLGNDLSECVDDLEKIFPECWESLSYNKKLALIDMRFQLGGKGFRGFKRLIAGVKTGNWTLAKFSIENSLYYKQTMNRAKENIKLLEEGKK